MKLREIGSPVREIGRFPVNCGSLPPNAGDLTCLEMFHKELEPWKHSINGAVCSSLNFEQRRHRGLIIRGIAWFRPVHLIQKEAG